MLYKGSGYGLAILNHRAGLGLHGGPGILSARGPFTVYSHPPQVLTAL